MSHLQEYLRFETRRRFLARGANLLGGTALAAIAGSQSPIRTAIPSDSEGNTGLPGLPHFLPRARNVIHLTMVGGPAQMDLFDYKPQLEEMYDKDLPGSVLQGHRLTTMTSEQRRFPIAPSRFKFSQFGQAGIWVTELLPHFSKCVDEVCFVRSMHTDAINHEPAITFLQTGNQVAGHPSMGSWICYGLGTENKELPAFVVLLSQCTNTEQVQALASGLWAAGDLPGRNTGVLFRNSGDPVLYLNNPDGIPSEVRRGSLDTLKSLNEMNYRLVGDPTIHARIEQYELAFRMQSSVPELANLSNEPQSVYALYGEAAKTPGSFANTALMARRMVERGVRFIQIFHNNWDTHANTVGRLPSQCMDIDQACFGLIQDLKQRGLLDSTLVLWGGEFGRTIYCQGSLSRQNYGRDHHGNCFTVWMAGGGIKHGITHGETDDFSFNIAKNPVSVHDLHATILHLLGIDHQKLTLKAQGSESRLTGVESANIIRELLA